MLRRFLEFIQNFSFHQRFDVYTDGSQKGAWGSWAFVVVKKNKIIHEDWGRERKARSNQMEFHAALKALAFIPSKAKVSLFTDSRILVRAMQNLETPEAFQNEISKLHVLGKDKKVSWHWVKAHSGVRYNERCDELCVQAREAN